MVLLIAVATRMINSVGTRAEAVVHEHRHTCSPMLSGLCEFSVCPEFVFLFSSGSFCVRLAWCCSFDGHKDDKQCWHQS